MKPTNALACFAAASVFSHDSEVCRKCCAFDACATASLDTLEQIRNIVNVADLLKRHEKAKKVARAALQAKDEAAAAAQPPGNVQPSLMGAVERKTEVVKIQFDVSTDNERIIATLPSKLQKITVPLCKKGYLDAAKKSVQEGRCTLAETAPGWFRVALTKLVSGGFSRAELRAAMMNELNWKEGSAAPHTSMAVFLFKAFGIAKEIEERLIPSPATA